MVPEIWSAPDIFFLSSWVIFSSFTAWKNENFKKMKKTLEISSFYTSLPKFMIICYTVPEIWRVTDVLLFFILGYIFPIYKWKKMKQPKTWKFQKNEKKKAWRYHFMQIMITYYTVPEIWHVKHVIVIFHFGLFFALLPPSPLSPTWRYHFTHAYRKLWLVDVRFLRYGERRTVGRTDGKGDI